MTDDSLLIKHRPTCFEEVIGQEAVVRSLFNALQKRSSHAFLLSGPSGVGKTTLARLAAVQLKCSPMDMEEIDAATNTGVDDMRSVTANLMYKPLGEGMVKVFIVDEVHQLSRAAFNSLLKVLEEAPWAYWFLCTTEVGKVPASIKTRCLAYELKPVPTTALQGLVEDIIAREKLRVFDGLAALCAKEAQGSPRQALANLAVCASAKNRAEAAELLSTAAESVEAIELVRALYAGAGWAKLRDLISQLGEVNPESVRRVVRAYGTTIVLKSNSEDKAGAALEVLDCFSEPFNSGDGLAPLLIACGKLTLS